MESINRELRIGIDVGSTTVKVVITDANVENRLQMLIMNHGPEETDRKVS